MGALAVLLIGGCASRPVIVHRLPDATPAADQAAAIARARSLAAAKAKETRTAASDTAVPGTAAPGTAASSTAAPGAAASGAAASGAPPETVTPVTPQEAPSLHTYDPFARFNRFDYRFNARFDRVVFLPVTHAYQRLPKPLQSGVHNFFSNLGEIDSIVNYTLQGRLGHGARSLGRFVLNSTVGIGGLLDVAGRLGLAHRPTGFGTTLAQWGMHPSAYLVLPFYGPSSIREGIGLAGDYGLLYAINPLDLYQGNASWGLGPVNAVDQRARVPFEYYSTGSPFEYEMIRFLYMRKLLIQDTALHPTPPTSPERPAGE
jgi:phospholipid-binding lipoprotein MlaA